MKTILLLTALFLFAGCERKRVVRYYFNVVDTVFVPGDSICVPDTVCVPEEECDDHDNRNGCTHDKGEN